MRDDFTQEVKDLLAKRVGFRCSNPRCPQPTSGPQKNPNKSVNVGEAAHITAASPGGPRYDASLSSEQRKASSNGIWLCGKCAKLIDNDPERYDVTKLQEWKRLAEDKASQAVEGPGASQLNRESCPLEVELSYSEVKITSGRHDYLLQVKVQNVSHGVIAIGHVDLRFPTRAIENPEASVHYIRQRSDSESAHFRAVFEDSNANIFPGDACVALSIPYYVDSRMYWNDSWVIQREVTATAYLRDQRKLTVETTFEDLQCF